MDCRETEQQIYFYRELTQADKVTVERHISSCEKCHELFAMVQKTEALISTSASIKPLPENASKLTSNIMQAIGKPHKQSHSLINSVILRYSMVAASLILIIAFGIESFSTVEPVTKRYPYTETVTLRSTSMAKSYRDKKEQLEKPSLYACVKSGECNSIIENFRKKIL